MADKPKVSLPSLPRGHYLAYWFAMTVASALFGGVVYFLLVKYDPLSTIKRGLV